MQADNHCTCYDETTRSCPIHNLENIPNSRNGYQPPMPNKQMEKFLKWWDDYHWYRGAENSWRFKRFKSHRLSEQMTAYEAAKAAWQKSLKVNKKKKEKKNERSGNLRKFLYYSFLVSIS